MVSVPFVYFGLLLLHQLHKNRWQIDIASLILILYTVSGFFSILIDVFELRSMDTRNYVISPWATIAYCGLLTMCVWPFMKYSNLRIKEIRPLRDAGVLKFLAWIFFFYFLINIVLSYNDIMNVVTSDELVKIRNARYKGYVNATWLSQLPSFARLPFVILNLIGGASWIFVFLAFFMVVIQKASAKYGVMFMLASINGVIDNLLDAGRSAMMYWVIGFIACFLLFKPYMTKKQKKSIALFSGIIVACFIFFMAAVTVSRFGERDAGEVTGTQGGIISYAGQSFINFCFFFDNFTCPFPSLQLIFPFTSKLLLGDLFFDVVQLQEFISWKSGNQIGVFYTFLGHIVVTSNILVMIIYALSLFTLSVLLVKKLKNRTVKLSTSYFYYLYSSVIFLGVFTHFYAGMARTAAVAFWGILLMILSRQR